MLLAHPMRGKCVAQAMCIGLGGACRPAMAAMAAMSTNYPLCDAHHCLLYFRLQHCK
jgi:hypothetical protein